MKREEASPFSYEKTISIRRNAKVVKGGRRFSFSALVVVGNGNGEFGYSFGKASEVSDAIRKATARARKKQYKVCRDGTSIPHDVIGRAGGGVVLLKPASVGTGIIAGGAVRALCEAVGIKDILTKSLGSGNPLNVFRATVAGVMSLRNRPGATEPVQENADTMEDVAHTPT